MRSARASSEKVDGMLTEEDTTERGKRAKQVCLPGNRTLSHVDIGSSLQALARVGSGLIGLVKVAGHIGG